MSLVSRMQLVYDRIYPISDRLGVPNHVSFTFLNKSTGIYTEVLPRPQVSSPPVNRLSQWRDSGVDVNNDSVYITGLSRTFAAIRIGTFCKIDGKDYTIMWVGTSNVVTFEVLCRPERAR